MYSLYCITLHNAFSGGELHCEAMERAGSELANRYSHTCRDSKTLCCVALRQEGDCENSTIAAHPGGHWGVPWV